MAVSRKAMTEGIRTPIFLCALIDAVLQSLSQKSKIFASSLYTREPWVLPHQQLFQSPRSKKKPPRNSGAASKSADYCRFSREARY